ncbi:MAG: cytidine deaminase [Tenericutes bacterium HGW-Tenericutes-4]|nr:MAG: cytidine deaminase [Tenericutes bacterium HGW-Tenericutes-4]
MEFNELLDIAKKYINPRDISPFIEGGQVSSAILTEKGNIYVGVCILTRCSQGLCAERNAANQMVTHNESKITKLVCVDKLGKLRYPCGSCREYLMQLHKDNANMLILTNIEKNEFTTLKELLPFWWGEGRF